jgi:uncharacterized cupin superfamily protein
VNLDGDTMTGNLTIDANSAENTLDINATVATQYDAVYFRVAGLKRWGFGKNTTAEGGTAAGSDFYFARYNNSGSWLGNAMTILRADGQVVFYTPPMLNGVGELATVIDLQSKSDVGHDHDDRYYTEAETTDLLAGKSDTTHSHDGEYADLVHTHDDRYYTETETDTALAGKSDTNHTHDDRYYTETETDAALSGKADTVHTHDDRYYTEGEMDSRLAGKSDIEHTHDGDYAPPDHTHDFSGDFVNVTGDTMSGDLAMGGNKVTGLPNQGTAMNANDAAPIWYADARASGIDPHEAVRTISRDPITLSGLQTIGGVALNEGDRVVVANQHDGSDLAGAAVDNGVYIASAGAWTRAADADEFDELKPGSFVQTTEGDWEGVGWMALMRHGETEWTPGSSDLYWAMFHSRPQIHPGDALIIDGNELDVVAGLGLVASANDIAIDRSVTDTWYSAAGQFLPLAGGTMSGKIVHADGEGSDYGDHTIHAKSWGPLYIDNNYSAKDLYISVTGGAAALYAEVEGVISFLSYDKIMLQSSTQEVDVVNARITRLIDPVGPEDAVNKQTLDAGLAGKSDTGHNHNIADVTGLEIELDGKADAAHNHDGDYVNVSGDTMTGDLNTGGNDITFGGGSVRDLNNFYAALNGQFVIRSADGSAQFVIRGVDRSADGGDFEFRDKAGQPVLYYDDSANRIDFREEVGFDNRTVKEVGDPAAATDAVNKQTMDTGLSGKADTVHSHDGTYSPVDHLHHGTYYQMTGGTLQGSMSIGDSETPYSLTVYGGITCRYSDITAQQDLNVWGVAWIEGDLLVDRINVDSETAVGFTAPIKRVPSTPDDHTAQPEFEVRADSILIEPKDTGGTPSAPTKDNHVAVKKYVDDAVAAVPTTDVLTNSYYQATNVPANGGWVTTPTITFRTPFPGVPSVTANCTSGRISIVVRNLTATSFDFGFNNWTGGNSGAFTVYWTAVYNP